MLGAVFVGVFVIDTSAHNVWTNVVAKSILLVPVASNCVVLLICARLNNPNH